MKTATLINEILENVEKLIKNIKTLTRIRKSFKKSKNVTV